MRQSRGFVLIIVIGILGALAAVALTLVGRAELSREVATGFILNRKVHLLARSGIEKGRLQILGDISSGRSLADPYGYGDGYSAFSLGISPTGSDVCRVRINDANGRININDGVMAGIRELGSAYKANRVDPWPDDGTGTYVEDISGLINLRIRRILNAYGDVHKFASDLEWPEWDQSVGNGPNYGTPYTFTSTAAGNRYEAMPGLDSTGLKLTALKDVADRSTGLGDRILASRPGQGFANVESLRRIVDDWAADVGITQAYLQGMTFFERVSGDLTHRAFEDDRFWRLTREFGRDGNSDGYVDYLNDFTRSPNNTANSSHMLPLDTAQIDFAGRWKPHSVSLININGATNEVRAALFYAIVNPSFVAEGIVGNVRINGGTGLYQMMSAREAIGSVGPLFKTSKIVENGVQDYDASNPMLPNVQRNRFMSLRDAMMLAQAVDDKIQAGNMIDSFNRFRQQLRIIKWPILDYERAGKINGYGQRVDACLFYNRDEYEQKYVEVCLPHLLSTTRRLPGWLHAPIALLSPYIQDGLGGFQTLGVARSVEDFVFRWHMPKISFLNSGIYAIESDASLAAGSSVVSRSIQAHVRLFSQKILRSQSGFVQATDAATDSRIRIGPEPSGVSAHGELGVVGLHDRGDEIPGPLPLAGQSQGVRIDFNGDLSIHSTSTIKPEDPSNDSDLNDPDFPMRNIEDAVLEGKDISFFETHPAGSDLSPFGGLSLSPVGHGPEAADVFSDCLYFRPMNTLMGPSNTIGERTSQGLISVWVRVPSGLTTSRTQRTIFDLTVWERVTNRTYTWGVDPHSVPPPNAADPDVVKLRPVTLRLCYRPRISINPNQRIGDVGTFDFEWIVGNLKIKEGAYPDSAYPTRTWPTLATIPRPNAQSELSNPLYSYMMGTTETNIADPLTDPPHWYESFDELPGIEYGTPVPTAKVYRQRLEPVQKSPYSMRPGSWVRLTCKWDFGNVEIPDTHKIKAVAHEMTTIGVNDTGIESPVAPSVPLVWVGIFGPPMNTLPMNPYAYFNPEMFLSVGELAYWSHSQYESKMLRQPGGAIPMATGEVYPLQRLNSSLDNLVMQFGSLPDPNLAAEKTGNSMAKMYNIIEGISGFNSMRYDLPVPPVTAPATEPVWVVNPSIPASARLVHAGARIYDVPFTPHVGTEWETMPVRAPRVDIEVHDGTQLSSAGTSVPIVDGPKTSKSVEWKSYPLTTVGPSTRIHLTYRSFNTNDDPITNVLTDIPWIKEVNWRYIEEEEAPILGWVVR